MSKRAPGQFARRPRDLYDTPQKAVPFVAAHLGRGPFAEPCAGNGHLQSWLVDLQLLCGYSGDIARGQDALDWLPSVDIEQIITNPPWSWTLLQPLLEHFIFICRRPTWLLLDADMMHNIRMHTFMNRCFKIVSVGRLKWVPDSAHQSLDNFAWYGFNHKNVGYPQFVPR